MVDLTEHLESALLDNVFEADEQDYAFQLISSGSVIGLKRLTAIRTYPQLPDIKQTQRTDHLLIVKDVFSAFIS